MAYRMYIIYLKLALSVKMDCVAAALLLAQASQCSQCANAWEDYDLRLIAPLCY